MENIYLKIDAPGLSSVCTSVVNVDHNSAYKISLNSEPSTSNIAGNNFSTQPSYYIMDLYDNIVDDGSHSVTASAKTNADCSTSSSTSLLGTSSNSSSGQGSFTNLRYTKAESIYIDLSASGLVSDCSQQISIDHNNANKLVFVQQPPSSVAAGANFSPSPSLQVRDAYDNLVDDGSFSVSMSAYTDSSCSSSSSGTTNGGTSTSSGGSVSFASLSHEKKETVYFEATATGLTAACSNASTIGNGVANKITTVTQPSSSGVAGINLTIQPQFAIRDQYDNLVTTSSHTVALAAYTDSNCTNASSGTFTATDSTNGTGLHTYTDVSHTKMEDIYVKATSSGLTSTCTNLIAVNHAAPYSINFLTQPVANQVAGNSFEIQPQVELKDAYGNLTSSQGYSVTFRAFDDATCTTASSVSLTGNSGTSSSGLFATTSLSANAAQTNLYLKAVHGSVDKCSNATTVYPALQVTYTNSVSTLNSQTVVIDGGVPPLSCSALTQDQSNATLGSCYTASCSGDLCINYTAGPIGGNSNDRFTVSDSGFQTSSETVSITVAGPVLELQAGNPNFGQSSIDITESLTFENTSLLANNLSVSITGPDAAYFEIGSLDTCTTSNLNTSDTCEVYIDFLASGAPAASNLNAILEVAGSNGGKVVIILTGETP